MSPKVVTDETKYLFIDTNVALHYARADKIVWSEVTDHSSNVIMVAPVVLRELDDKKFNARTAKIKRRANEYVSWLWSILDNLESRKIRPDATLDFLPNEPNIDFPAYNLKDAVADDHLLASILSFQNETGNEAAIVTSDVGLKLKAKAHGIEVICPPDRFKQNDEPDEIEKENIALKKELTILKKRRPSLVLFATEVQIDNGGGILTFPQNNVINLKPPYIVKKSEYVRRLLAEEKAKRPYLKNADSYNNQLNDYFEQFEEYLGLEYEAIITEGRCYPIAIKICNDATQLATNIDAGISFPDFITVSEERITTPKPPEPKPPTRPTSNSVSDAMRALVNGIPQFNELYLSSPRNFGYFPNTHKSGPNVKDDNDVWYWCDEIKHGFCSTFNKKFYISIPYNLAQNGFQAICSLSCNELPKPQEHVLNFSFNND